MLISGKKIKSEFPLELDLRNLNKKYKKQEQKKVKKLFLFK